MLEFSAQRRPGETYQDRGSYLADQQLGNAPFEPWLCHALALVNEPLDPDEPDLDDERPTEPSRGFPWLTLVLGSGCYEPRDPAVRAVIDGLPAAVAAALSDVPPPDEGEERPAVTAERFTRTLIRDRLAIEVTPDAAPVEPVARDAAELAYLTALLTRFFHEIKALSIEAPSRWSDDVAVLDPDLQRAGELRAFIVEPARAVIRKLTDALKGRDLSRMAIHNLLERIRADLDSTEEHHPSLHAVHLRVLAECTWHALTLGTPVYPGWSDLLVDLSLFGQLLPAPNAGRPRPLFDSLTHAPDLIAKRYAKTIDVTWDAQVRARRQRTEADAATTVDEAPTMHDRAARVLVAQAALRSATSPAERPPVAAAFVTTFDLELEMALWSCGSPFLVAIPIYLYRGRPGDLDRTATLCWLGAVITPDHDLAEDEQLDRILHPSAWTVLSGHKRFERELGQLPVVVRLSGCPSIQLPRRRTAIDLTASLWPGAARPADDIGHAVLLDEYAALQHTSVENLATHHQQSKLDRRYGLPEAITGVSSNRNSFARFWMIMGVQMGDSGVRFRLASQIGTPAASASADLARRPTRAGVVVNRRLDVTEQDLLYWFGFDIVTARCQTFGDDLTHYERHLRDPEARTRPRTQCPLP